MTDNAARYHHAKLRLRQLVLDRVRPARVLDLYAGRGAMWSGAWRRASGYLGVDQRQWRSDEPHPRIVGDALLSLDRLDLSAYNVFDLDAYGEPWPAALGIAARRRWAAGEVGALVLTDGGSLFLRRGNWSRALAALIPMHPDRGVRDPSEQVHRQAIGAWCARAGVEPVWWMPAGGYTGAGSSRMIYSATVFRGRVAEKASNSG
ncbi:MAG: hypothetical protein KJ725_20555 [Gammaproteobacteria bacterium]|nr:hypothetical protein [Gammaproteobacteria bacterium]